MPESILNIFALKDEQSKQSKQSKEIPNMIQDLSPKKRKQQRSDSFERTRNISIDNFMKYQWSWSL
jgi:hypothetical protein